MNETPKKKVAFEEDGASPSSVTEDYGAVENGETSPMFIRQGSSSLSERSWDGESSVRSFDSGRYSLSAINAENVWTSMPRSAEKYEVDMIPTEMTNNVKLVADANLDPGEKGKLFYSQESFYNPNSPPAYALSVNTDIYEKIWCEVNDSYVTPCGMYFCCHGGDGAHTGVSHDDHVDIRVAYVLVGVMFLAMLFLEYVVPAPFNEDDDFFVQ